MTGRPNTRHLVNRRMYGGVNYARHHSYKTKSDAKAAIDSLKKQGYLARLFTSKGEEYTYTVYKRHPKSKHWYRT